MSADREIVSAAKIARRAGCSERTIRRKWRAGELPFIYRSGSHTSPLRARRSAIDAWRGTEAQS